MIDAVVNVVRAVEALEARRAATRVGRVVVLTGGSVLTRVEALTAELYLLFTVLSCNVKKRILICEILHNEEMEFVSEDPN